jgi:hypothetical protein
MASKKDDFRKNREKASIKQRILDDMQNRTEEDVLEAYKNTDRITRNQMWIRFPAFRKAFNDINDSAENNWQVSGVISRSAWYKKEAG